MTVPMALPAKLALVSLLTLTVAQSQAADAGSQLAAYSAQAGTPADAGRGQQFFTRTHGGEWSCASCHAATPTGPGRHAATGKSIGALSPAFNPDRFTDPAKTEKWFRRNCKDVLSRECSAAEKADVLARLLTLRR